MIESSAVTALTALAERNPTTAVLATAGGAIAFFHKVIGPETPLR